VKQSWVVIELCANPITLKYEHALLLCIGSLEITIS